MVKLENILAIDIGSKRIGLAIANTVAKLPVPLEVIANDRLVFQTIKDIISKYNVKQVVVGLPRNMSGEETRQSQFSREFAAKLEKVLGLKVKFADESLSTKRAQTLPSRQGKSNHLDSMAACFILEEYLEQK